MRWWLRRQAVRIAHGGAAPKEAPFVRMFRDATALRFSGDGIEAFREGLEAAFRALTPEAACRAVRLDRLRPLLAADDRYKVTLTGDAWSPEAGNAAFRQLTSRLAVFDVTADVMRLRAEDSIPPHGHRDVVSAMYVLEGESWCRTWDTLGDPSLPEVPLRPGYAGLLGPGGLSTSSESHHNLHWMAGHAPVSYILRFTITDVRSARGIRYGRGGARCYIDPTGPVDAATGLITGRKVDGKAAQGIQLR